MAQFIALDPNVEVIGAAILATTLGMEQDMTPLLAEFGIVDVRPEGWYPQQAWLDVLREISNTSDLVAVGMKIPKTALWPPGIDSVAAALKSIDVAYHLNHRNGEIGSYRVEVIDDQHVRVICDNPYPSDFDYGIIYQTTRMFLPRGASFTVQRADSPCRKNDDACCVYDVTWSIP